MLSLRYFWQICQVLHVWTYSPPYHIQSKTGLFVPILVNSLTLHPVDWPPLPTSEIPSSLFSPLHLHCQVTDLWFAPAASASPRKFEFSVLTPELLNQKVWAGAPQVCRWRAITLAVFSRPCPEVPLRPSQPPILSFWSILYTSGSQPWLHNGITWRVVFLKNTYIWVPLLGTLVPLRRNWEVCSIGHPDFF